MYSVTYIRRKGGPARVMSIDLDSIGQAQDFCTNLAASMHRVVLAQPDDDGLPTIVRRWEGHVMKRNTVKDVSIPEATEVIEGEIAETDEAGGFTHSVYCMGCHENREVYGEVTVTANGRRQFRGTCPVCGRKAFQFLPGKAEPMDDTAEDFEPETETSIEFDETAERPESPNTPPDFGAVQDAKAIEHALSTEPAGRRGSHFICSCGEWDAYARTGTNKQLQVIAEWEAHKGESAAEAIVSDDIVTEAPEPEETTEVIAEAIAEAVPAGTPMENVAEATSSLAADFSHAAADTEAAKPRKRSSKAKAKENKAEPVPDAEVEAVKQMETAECPQCHSQIPIKVSGDGKMRYLMVHPNAVTHNPQCHGSRATVDEKGIAH